ncbi:bcl-2-binding component 3 [Xiphias gladius]|uniref:bcl-2-binding component 3 n=1 Tax=Xiphias gladius TaxID=8245 RepID=UPI001A98FE1C|nr:bcl-2-binding component 3 [Xiphias gladius]XP_039987586.1 bcl-2-binding component 3 [Xiphias gladius]
MARAETIESVAETGGGNGPQHQISCHNTCCMELPRPFHTWPGLLTTTTITAGSRTGTGAIRLHRNHHHPHSLQPLLVSYPPPDETRSHQQSQALSRSPAPPPSLLRNRREGRGGGAVTPSALSGEESGSDREVHLEAFSRQGPLPDLLPRNEHPSWAPPHHGTPRREAVRELEVRRVASQLRTIGDEFNATVLRRAHIAPHWQHWRDACRGLLTFITQTLSTLYRLTGDLIVGRRRSGGTDEDSSGLLTWFSRCLQMLVALGAGQQAPGYA